MKTNELMAKNKRGSGVKFFVIFTLVFSVVLAGCAGPEISTNCRECKIGCINAEDDAKYDYKNETTGWSFAGGILMPLGIALAALFPVKNPAPEKIAGKTPDYVEAYAKCYSDTYRLNRVMTASAWCGVTVGCNIAMFLAIGWFFSNTGL